MSFISQQSLVIKQEDDSYRIQGVTAAFKMIGIPTTRSSKGSLAVKFSYITSPHFVFLIRFFIVLRD